MALLDWSSQIRRLLTDALRLVAKNSVVGGSNADGHVFDLSPYRPTPTIVEAAQKLYAGHEIADIGRGDAADAELQAAADMHRVRWTSGPPRAVGAEAQPYGIGFA